MKRIDMSFPSGDARCDVWLYLPEGPGPFPAVVAAHGVGAIRQVRFGAYARQFTAAGYAMLTFDYRHWGTSEGRPRFLCDIAMQQEDIHSAIDFARTLACIDRRRIALFGTSFGGGHVLSVSAARDDLAAVISQCAVVDSLSVAMRTRFGLTLRMLMAGAIDVLKQSVGLSPFYIKLAGQPGEIALMTAPDAEASYRMMIDEPSPWENKIAAKLAFSMPSFRPIRDAHKIKAPLLMVVCDRDEICPGARAAAAAKRAPKGSAVHFDTTHFGIYFDPWFEPAVSAMIQFLDENLAGPSARSDALRRFNRAEAAQ